MRTSIRVDIGKIRRAQIVRGTALDVQWTSVQRGPKRSVDALRRPKWNGESRRRGQEKNPGEFRRSQNWIGAANCTLKEARYIPPNVEDMNDALTDLEYLNILRKDT